MKVRIFPPEELIEDGVVTLPLSKSLSMRALIMNALTGDGEGNPGAIARCGDTEVLEAALGEYRRRGSAGTRMEVDVKDSGAALRFLTAFFAIRPGADVLLTGSRRLQERPMAELVKALRELGASIEYAGAEGCAPLLIHGRELQGGSITVDATISSQFISALLMVAPAMSGGLDLHFDGEPVSLPYIQMTAGMMEQRGIEIEREPLRVYVAPGSYRHEELRPEGDWSAAAFIYEVSALSAGWIRIANLTEDTLQGDKAAARYFECLGVNTEEPEDGEEGLSLCPSPEVYGRLELDLTDNPDLAPSLAVTSCLIGVPFRLTGLQTLGGKECDRLEALCTELSKLGRIPEKIRDYGIEWEGKSVPVGALPVFSSHNDHRMAMALAPVAVYVPGIIVEGAEAVRKSFPGYWDTLRTLGFRVDEAADDAEFPVEEEDAL